MFYSQDILQKRGGKFGIVWLAATRAGTLSKRDYYSVHVVKSCDDVLQHVTLKATLHGVKQRFSLYLSSQLMYGITKVYGKQADYLLAEVQRLHRQFSSTRLLLATLADPDDVDHFQLPKAARSAAYCTLPQPDLNQDIFMSDWLMTLRVPPNIFEEEFISSSIMRGSPGISFISPDRPISPLEELEDVWDRQHIVSDIGEITLREDEPIVPDVQVGELDDLGGLAPHGMEEALASIQYPDEEGLLVDGKGDADIDITVTGEGKVWTVEEETGRLVLSPIATRRRSKRLVSSEGTAAEVVSTPVVASTKPPEKESSDEGVPEFKTPQSPSGKVVDIPILHLAAIHEEEGSTPVAVPKGRKRRRQLVFVDLKTQLSKTDMRSNMSDFENLIEADVLANPNPLPSAKDLFKEPARKAARMSSVLVDLWQEGASVSAPRETEEGDDRVWSTEYLRPSVPRTSSSDEVSPESKLHEVPELGRAEFESPEHLREQASKADDSRASAAKMDDTPASLILTDISKLSESREGSRQGSFIAEPSLQRLRRPEESIEEEGLAAVQDIQMDGVVPHPDEFLIPEEPELTVHEQGMQSGDWDGKPAEMSTSEDEEKGIPHENIYNKILELTSKQGSTSFQELVPFTTDRKIAAKIFAICLEYAKERLIHFKQSRPYANILIYCA